MVDQVYTYFPCAWVALGMTRVHTGYTQVNVRRARRCESRPVYKRTPALPRGISRVLAGEFGTGFPLRSGWEKHLGRRVTFTCARGEKTFNYFQTLTKP